MARGEGGALSDVHKMTLSAVIQQHLAAIFFGGFSVIGLPLIGSALVVNSKLATLVSENNAQRTQNERILEKLDRIPEFEARITLMERDREILGRRIERLETRTYQRKQNDDPN